MGTLKYAILGLLYQGPRSGYDMAQEFQNTLNEFWSAKHSQIYPELKKLTAKGLVEYHVEIVGTVLEKKQYSITSKGREEFLQWMNCDLELPPTPKSEFRLQLFFSGCLTAERRMEMMAYQLKLHQDRLTYLRNNQRKFTEIPSKDNPEFGDYLVLQYAIMREENDCKWLEGCMKLCATDTL